MAKFYITRKEGSGYVSTLSLDEIQSRLAAGALKESFYATEADGRSFSQFIRSGEGKWRTLSALLQETELENGEESFTDSHNSDSFDQMLLQTLPSSLFRFDDSDIYEVLAICERTYQCWKAIGKRLIGSRLPLAEAEETFAVIEELSTTIPSLCRNADRFADVLSAAGKLFENGASLLETHTLLTGLTSGFSLTGSRDRVHDEHFNRLRAYSLSRKRLESLELSIKALMRFGSLVAIGDSSHDSSVECSRDSSLADAIPSILQKYGLGMSSATPDALFRHPPAVWKSLQDTAKRCVAVLPFIEDVRRISVVADEFRGVLPELEDLVSNARQSGSADVTLDGFFATKKAVKQLRVSIGRVSI